MALPFYETVDLCDFITVLRRLKTEHFVFKSMIFRLQALSADPGTKSSLSLSLVLKLLGFQPVKDMICDILPILFKHHIMGHIIEYHSFTVISSSCRIHLLC